MKIVTWNCNGALRNKFEFLIPLDADIYIIQECENPKEVKHEKFVAWAHNYLWLGDNKNKGLGVFAKEDIQLNALDWTNSFKDHTVKHFLPFLVNNDFQVLAVWAHQNNSPNFGYIGQFWKYLQVNKGNFKRIIIAGDFNSNAIWDAWDRWWNHSDVINELNEIGIKSLYHSFTNEEQGKESKPTFYLNRKLHKPYHIDYIFGSNDLIDNSANIQLFDVDDWIKISDHVPMALEF